MQMEKKVDEAAKKDKAAQAEAKIIADDADKKELAQQKVAAERKSEENNARKQLAKDSLEKQKYFIDKESIAISRIPEMKSEEMTEFANRILNIYDVDIAIAALEEKANNEKSSHELLINLIRKNFAARAKKELEDSEKIKQPENNTGEKIDWESVD